VAVCDRPNLAFDLLFRDPADAGLRLALTVPRRSAGTVTTCRLNVYISYSGRPVSKFDTWMTGRARSSAVSPAGTFTSVVTS